MEAMEQQQQQKSTLEVSKIAFRAMEAARMAVQKGGTRIQAEAAAYEVLSEGMAANTKHSSSGDSSLLSSPSSTITADQQWIAKKQAAIFAAMALAPTMVGAENNHSVPPETLRNDDEKAAEPEDLQDDDDKPPNASSSRAGPSSSIRRRPDGSSLSEEKNMELTENNNNNSMESIMSPLSLPVFIAGTTSGKSGRDDHHHDSEDEDAVSQISSVPSLRRRRQDPGGSVVGNDLYWKENDDDDNDNNDDSIMRSTSSLPEVIETNRTYRDDDVSSLPSVRREPSGDLADKLLLYDSAATAEDVLPWVPHDNGQAVAAAKVETSNKLKKDPKASKRKIKGSHKSKDPIIITELVDKPESKKKKKKRRSSKSKGRGGSQRELALSVREPSRKSKSPRPSHQPRPNRLRIQSGDKVWLARGYKAVEPPATARSYFANIAARYGDLAPTTPDDKQDSKKQVLSVCIPCFNEEASALYRTIHSLRRSYLPHGVIMEILVVVDGRQQISPSMAKYLKSLFGISITEDDPRKNPFVTFPSAQTIVVENVSNGDARDPLTLLLKRTNKRKVNSQKWWFFGHARDARAEFAFATDCGIVFDRKCLLLLLERMMREPHCHGLTGNQRVMCAQWQGDGSFEPCVDPMGWFLRQLQSYDIEMSQCTSKSLVDSLGFIPVLPGPCSLFRYSAFVGVSREYFHLTTMALKGDSSDLVLGNVQLAEDRFPPILLTFGSSDVITGESAHSQMTLEGSKKNRLPITGFVRDAYFYFEAEKPLGQLVKQRRRWINGAYMAAYWTLKGGWIGLSKQNIFMKLGAAGVLLFELLTGAITRLTVPATLTCGLFYMVKMIPAIYRNDVAAVTDIMEGNFGNPLTNWHGSIAAAIYLGGFAIFMLAHTPRAVPSEGNPGDAVTYQIDTRSAYRPWLFAMGYLLNLILTAIFFYVGYGVYSLVGWSGSPLYFRLLTILMVFPYVVALLDGIINSDTPSIKSFVNLILLTPAFLSASLWFYVWFPCYASARISDLSWGNRASHQDSSTSIIARHRAYLGRVVSVSIVAFNILLAFLIIFMMNFLEKFLSVFFFILLAFNILLNVANLIDMCFRFFRHTLPYWLYGSPPPPLKLRAANVDEEDEPNEVGIRDEYESEGSQDFEVFYDMYEQQDDSKDARSGEESILSRLTDD